MLPLLDTHQHLIYLDRWAYDWTTGVPRLEGRSFRLEDYAAAADGCGIASSVFMEAAASDPEDETAFVDSLAADPERAVVGIVAAAYPERDDFAAQLERLRGTRAVGVRRILHVEPDELSQGASFRENLRLLPAHGLTFDLCVLARQLRVAYELVQACPEVQFVLDHCGVPDIAGAGLDPWRSDLARLAELPNVCCKVSGLLAYCAPGAASLDAVRPYVEHSIESFGWDRVVWGSDWPVVETTSSLRAWVETTRRLVEGEPEARQRMLFHDNARRVYGLEGPG